MAKGISMAELAEKLGVSKCLVSLALSNKYGVSEEMRSKIILAAIENGYDFSRCKRNSRSGRNTISVLIYNMQILTNSFWSEVIIGLERELVSHGFSMNIMFFDDNTVSENIAVELKSLNSKGIVMIGSIVNEANVKYFKTLNIPMVLIDSYSYVDTDVDCVMASNYRGGYNAAKYIVSKGHKNICFVGDIAYAFSFNQRYLGFKDYFNENHSDDINVTYLIDRYDEPILKNYNKKELEAYIEENRNNRMALVCASDPIAFVIYSLCKKYELKIGEQVSVLGFDNREAPDTIIPRLSSVNIPKTELGKYAGELLRQKNEAPDRMPQIIQLPTSIEEKDSVADLTK